MRPPRGGATWGNSEFGNGPGITVISLFAVPSAASCRLVHPGRAGAPAWTHPPKSSFARRLRTSRWTRCASRRRAMSCASGQRWAGRVARRNPPCVPIPKQSREATHDPNRVSITPTTRFADAIVLFLPRRSRRRARRLATARAGLNSVAILADGTVVAGSDAGTIEAWSLLPGNLHPGRSTSRRRLARPRRRGHRAGDVRRRGAAARPGQILVSAGGDGAIVAGSDSTTVLISIISGRQIATGVQGASRAPRTGARPRRLRRRVHARVRRRGRVHPRVERPGRWELRRERRPAAARPPNIKAPTLIAAGGTRGRGRPRRSGPRVLRRVCESIGAIAVGFESGDVAFLKRMESIRRLPANRRRCVPAASFTRTPTPSRGLAFHPASRRLASCGDDGFVCVHVGELPATTRWRPHGSEYASRGLERGRVRVARVGPGRCGRGAVTRAGVDTLNEVDGPPMRPRPRREESGHPRKRSRRVTSCRGYEESRKSYPERSRF